MIVYGLEFEVVAKFQEGFRGTFKVRGVGFCGWDPKSTRGMILAEYGGLVGVGECKRYVF